MRSVRIRVEPQGLLEKSQRVRCRLREQPLRKALVRCIQFCRQRLANVLRSRVGGGSVEKLMFPHAEQHGPAPSSPIRTTQQHGQLRRRAVRLVQNGPGLRALESQGNGIVVAVGLGLIPMAQRFAPAPVAGRQFPVAQGLHLECHVALAL